MMIRSEQDKAIEVLGVRIAPTVERITICGRNGVWVSKSPVCVKLEVNGKSTSIPLGLETESGDIGPDPDST
jgi:hypothetical protein